MKIINASIEQMNDPFISIEILRKIEKISRICYKSEDKITRNSALDFVKMLINSEHYSMIEHGCSPSIKFICDRGTSQQILRSRLFSFAESSTRYINYNEKDILFIRPCWIADLDFSLLEGRLSDIEFNEKLKNIYGNYTLQSPEIIWCWAMRQAELNYYNLIESRWKPQQARSVLPNSVKTEIVVTGNLRQWRHFLKLRTAKDAHPQIQEVANMALDLLRSQIQIIFDDI